jgi:hypothetical protein
MHINRAVADYNAKTDEETKAKAGKRSLDVLSG